MKNTRWLVSSLLLGLSGMVGAQCVSTPRYAFNGLVRIEYPRTGGSAFLQQACDAGSRQLRMDVMSAARQQGIPVSWVEIYAARGWGSTFHDLIYKTRASGYGQADFKKYSVAPRTNMSSGELLVYATKTGKYIAMRSYREGSSTANTRDVFVVYGN
ncbi:hypothetical protein MF271_17670 (plasmid) [Deinococcus sp. KNUC1210]|uniref:hypothetical protein n=1 Tax=Deinococcus sp. KNUC1210 TaxID=2917691 RepID=UPI001EEFE0DB|nr:hypothetical protein [Deinococcus sp. KNUC1210]ULH17008.1 hypothetical protein MF271_17670 [Deinococcus sp. KNUC1210]